MIVNKVLLIFLFLFSMSVHAGCKTKDGKSLVLNDAAPCLKDPAYRKAVESAALSGSIEAASLLADYYKDGAGDDEESAIHWLRVYVKNGADAPIILGQLLLKSKTESDVLEGEEILLSRSKRGDIKSSEIFADHLNSTDRNMEARLWYENAALSGGSEAMVKLGDLLLARKDKASKYLGVMWTLVAANQFTEGSFMKKKLLEKASSSASQLHLNIDAAQNYALVMTSALQAKEQ